MVFLGALALVGAAALTASVPAARGAADRSSTAASAAGPTGLHVIPFPNTPDASPLSHVIFSSLRPSQLRWVSVRGSRSGRHSGHLVVLPYRAGTAFEPDRPFAPGERVSVTAALTSSSAGTASGDPGATELHFSFTTAPPGAASGAARTARASSSSRAPSQHFLSAPGLRPPVLTVTSDSDHRSGYMFVSPNNGSQRGPMILDSAGHLVWFRPTNGVDAYNLEVQTYRGFPALTWWQGGEDVIMGRSYRIMAIVHAGNGYRADVHEFQITRQSTALLCAVVKTHADLRAEGGSSNGTVEDNVIQEIDPKTGQVLWEWHSLRHIPISDTYNKVKGSGSFSYFHLNSIQQLPDGNLLISARNTWAVYEISRSTGKVIWELGGKHSSFHINSGAKFEWQHDAHLVGNTLTVFDDAALPQEERQSSAKELRLNMANKKASLIRAYDHTPPLLAGRAGSMQILPNGNVFVGWGSSSEFSEYTAAGKQIFNATFPLRVFSYRAYRFPWTAQPRTPPHMASVAEANGDVRVFASWNGATRVASWKVLGGPRHNRLGWFTTSPRSGFQTAMTLHSEPRYLAVQALDSSGHVLGTSDVHPDHPHIAIFGPDAFVPDGGGYARLPVGCFTGHDCRVGVRVNWGRRVVAETAPQPVHSRTGTLLRFRLSARGMKALRSSSGQRMRVLVSVHDSSGASASKHMSLYGYSVSGAGPRRTVRQTQTVQIASTTGFVSSAGRGQLLGACYGASPCHLHATISSGGRVIATVQNEHLGAEELGYIYFQLTSSGQTMLQQAKGNQLPARVTVTNGHDTARGQIALTAYS